MVTSSVPLAEPVQAAYFAALTFKRLAEAYGEHSLLDCTQASGTTQISISNVIPGAFLAEKYARTHCCVLFSATLQPRQFYCDVLGLPRETRDLNVCSPFATEQLEVNIVAVSTRYRDRAGTRRAIATLMRRQYLRQPGNYLCFVSSFDYLNSLFDLFASMASDIPAWRQVRQMSEKERQVFLDRFTAGGRGIGFAVLGGAFAEGIDLPGDRLIGAFIATLGLPQVNRINDDIMQVMEQRFGAGYAYTYRYPGLRKVVQAAGRVIRSARDRGVLYLIDDRYADPDIRALLPEWWHVAHPEAEKLDELLRLQ
jgi:DNA excision repair protein ERCC-2